MCGGKGTNQTAYSANGSIWYPVNTGFAGGTCYSVASKGSQIALGGTGPTNSIFSNKSSGGDPAKPSGPWIPQDSVLALLYSVGCIGVNPIMYVIATSKINNYVYFAGGGISDTSVIAPGNTIIPGISSAFAWTGTRWVLGTALSGGNSIYNSVDGINWTPSANGGTILSSCYAIASRRVLPIIGTIVGQPYYIGNAANWYASGTGPSGNPYSIPQALDLLAAYIRQSTNAAGGSPYWPT